jgi:membrane peptidoglycan carboxypeptidase
LKKVFKSLILAVFLLIVAIGAIVLWRGYSYAKQLTNQVPLSEAIAQVQNQEDYVSTDQIPTMLKEATVAIEDHRFYEHSGIDVISLLRAIASQIIPGMSESGGSTISQQTVKNLYGLFDGGIDRKAAEFFLAYQLEQQCSKSEILTLYVNIINYGDNHIGIYEAASGYFGESVSELTDSQCTMLAGIPQSPSNYQLSNHAEAAKARQKQVLQAMVEYDYLTQYQAEIIYNESIYA